MFFVCVLLFRIVSLAIFMYLLDYIMSFFKNTRLIVKDGRFRHLLLSCDSVINGYKPSVLFHRATLNTLATIFLFKTYPIEYENDVLTLQDGGQILLSWCGNKSDFKHIVVVIPGVSCHSKTNYITYYVKMLQNLGNLVVVLNYRGMGTALTTLKISSGCDSSDLEESILYITRKYPDRKLICFGMSLGGMILTRFLSTSDNANLVLGALILSTPFDSLVTSAEIEKFPNNWIFNRLLTKSFAKRISKNSKIFENSCYDVEVILKANRLRDIDTYLTSKMMNFKSCDDYYRECSVGSKICNINVPCLFLNAADDMFSPLRSIPILSFENNEKTALLLTPRGGHLAFLQGLPVENNYVSLVLRDCVKLFGSMSA